MLTKDQLTELEAKHKRIAHCVGKDGAWEVVFRRPNRGEYKRFRSMANNPSQAADAQENLARSCVVHPSPEEFDRLLEDYPAIPEACAKQLGEITGFAVDEAVKT